MYMPLPSGVTRRKSSRSYSSTSIRNSSIEEGYGAVQEGEVLQASLPSEVIRVFRNLGKDVQKIQDVYKNEIKEHVQLMKTTEEKYLRMSETATAILRDAVKDLEKETLLSQEELLKQLKEQKGQVYEMLSPELKETMKIVMAQNANISIDMIKNFQTRAEKAAKEMSEKEEIKVKKRDETIKDFFERQLEKLDNFITKNETLLQHTILGPFSLLIRPIEDMFGGTLYEGIKSIGSKIIKKRNPKEGDLIKNKELGPLFLWNKLKKYFSDEEKEKRKIKLKDFLTKIPGGLLGTIMKGGAIAAIAGGVIWAVVDGIKGAMMAEKWGVSKMSGFIGAFLGSTEKGFKGAFKSAGKWALIGVGIGFLAGGPIGAIIGGLLGGAIGFILGYIGGEEIAKGFEGIKKKLGEAWKSKEFEDKLLGIPKILLEGLMGGLKTLWSTIPVIIADIFTNDPKVLANVKKWSKDIVNVIAEFSPMGFIKNWFTVTLDSVKKFRNTKDKKSFTKRLFTLAIDLISAPVQAIWKSIKNAVPAGVKEKIGKFVTDTLANAGKWITNVPGNVADFAEKVKNFAGDVLNKAIDWFKGMGNKALDLKDNIKTFFTNTFNLAKDNISNFFKNNTIQDLIEDFLITPVLNFFKGIGDTFDFLTELGLTGIAEILTTKKTFSGEFAKYQMKKEMNTNEYKEWEKKQTFAKGTKEEVKYQKYLDSKPTKKVNDAIIKPDGTIIRTHPEDTIIATKNSIEEKTIIGDITGKDRSKVPLLGNKENNNYNYQTSNLINTASLENKLDVMIALLKELLKKDVSIQMPPNQRVDLDTLIKGVII